jgi:hypothetical protein
MLFRVETICLLKVGKEEKIFGSEREKRLSAKGFPLAILFAKISDITRTKNVKGLNSQLSLISID